MANSEMQNSLLRNAKRRTAALRRELDKLTATINPVNYGVDTSKEDMAAIELHMLINDLKSKVKPAEKIAAAAPKLATKQETKREIINPEYIKIHMMNEFINESGKDNIIFLMSEFLPEIMDKVAALGAQNSDIIGDIVSC